MDEQQQRPTVEPNAPNLGANAPKLGARGGGSSVPGVASLLFGKTRLSVLWLFLGQPELEFRAREAARLVSSGQGAVSRELRALTAAGILTRRARGRQVSYQANAESPVFPELRGLLVKTAGVLDVLRGTLASLSGRIAVAFIFGSFAKGTFDGRSDLDLMVVGDVRFGEVVSALRQAQDELRRELNPTAYSVQEFKRRLAEGGHFVQSVLGEPKLYVIGSDGELARLAQPGLDR